jgi:S1-C subfamily serine protease
LSYVNAAGRLDRDDLSYLPTEEVGDSPPANPASPENVALGILKGEIDYDPATKELAVPVPDVWLGAQLKTVGPENAEEPGLDSSSGAVVVSVIQNSPADKAGIKAGDAILKVDESKTDTNVQVIKEIGQKKPGDKVDLEIIRKGEKKTVVVTIEKRPDDAK